MAQFELISQEGVIPKRGAFLLREGSPLDTTSGRILRFARKNGRTKEDLEL
jgi:hypothetical protein